jgi:hypothetical protein
MITQRLRGICFLLLDIKLWVYHFDCNLLLDVYLVVLVISFSGDSRVEMIYVIVILKMDFFHKIILFQKFY